MAKSLNEIVKEVHEHAVNLGWWSKPTDTIAAKLLLIHSEVSEATEAMRDAGPCPHGAPDVDYDDLRKVTRWEGKPEGFGIELADTAIRIFDLCAQVGIDLEEMIRVKHEYNQTRAVRHGGKMC